MLIVEDDLDIGRSLKELFVEEGYSAVLAPNGKLALDYLQKAAVLPCAILLDIMMPVMDGVQFWQEAQKDPRFRGIHLVVMTADASIETRRAQIRAEVFLRKPLNVSTVLDTVERLCA